MVIGIVYIIMNGAMAHGHKTMKIQTGQATTGHVINYNKILTKNEKILPINYANIYFKYSIQSK